MNKPLSSIWNGIREICYECVLIAVGLIFLPVVVYATTGTDGSAISIQDVVDRGLWVAVCLSLFGGFVGLIGRLRSQNIDMPKTKIDIFVLVVSELGASVLIGVLILLQSQDNDWSEFRVMASILVCSWLGTKAGRLLLTYIGGIYDSKKDGKND